MFGMQAVQVQKASLRLSLQFAEHTGHGMQAAAVYVDQTLEEVGRGGVATAVQHHGKEVRACWQGLRFMVECF